MRKPDGGPEFPYVVVAPLRDYFAAAALQGYLAGNIDYSHEVAKSGRDAQKILADDCYIMADAMLAERDK